MLKYYLFPQMSNTNRSNHLLKIVENKYQVQCIFSHKSPYHGTIITSFWFMVDAIIVTLVAIVARPGNPIFAHVDMAHINQSIRRYHRHQIRIITMAKTDTNTKTDRECSCEYICIYIDMCMHIYMYINVFL